jgi:8-hydroxy-5-deazaflavin:NADPH oxidoreductase
MRIGVLGTGTVGRVIGARLLALGNEVTIGTRDVDTLLTSTEVNQITQETFADWHAKNPQVSLGTFTEAAEHGELVVNATNGAGSLDALRAAGEHHLDGKVLIDIANPLDSSGGMPPTLFVSNTDSLGEQIQRAFPAVRVVKALNTMNAFVMADPSLLAGGDHSVFVCGNDDQAKKQVAEILRSFGWRDVIDLGDITSARGTESYLPLWLRLWGALQAPMFNIKVVR